MPPKPLEPGYHWMDAASLEQNTTALHMQKT